MTVRITAVSKLKHADLWAAAKKHGSVAALAAAAKVSKSRMYLWVNLQGCPSQSMPEDERATLDANLYLATGKGLDELFPAELRAAHAFLAEDKQNEQTVDVPAQALLTYAETTKQRLTYAPVEAVDLPDDVDEALTALTDRQREVIRLRFGLGGCGSHTYREIAEILGTSSSYPMQVEHQAIVRMQSPSVAGKLVGHLD